MRNLLSLSKYTQSVSIILVLAALIITPGCGSGSDAGSSVASKTITQAFTVTSANGNPGLAGEVHDTRGKYLLGAFITSFTAGALNWFSQDTISP
jgi:hypothetical protein